jgi:hypothetical protein
VPDLSAAERVVRVVTHQGWHIEGDRQAGLALRQQELVPLVRLLGGAIAGELADGPELAAVHRRVDAAGVGKLSGVA